MEISIVIPVYNKAEYIGGCLEGLLKQDFPSFEVICVCDGSTDNSGDICDQWAAKDTRIRVIHKDNGGVTAARQRGVEEALGRYIIFVDADDELLPHALHTLHDAIERTKADEVVATFRLHTGNTSPIVYTGEAHPDSLIQTIIAGKNRFPILWGCIFRKEILADTLDTPRAIIEGEDKMMQVKVLMKQPKVYFIPDCVYQYTVGLPNNRRHTLEHEKLYDDILRQVLAPRWDVFHTAYVLHQLKEYERFIADGNDDVRRAYYQQAITKLPAGIPLYDKIVWALPPLLARPLIGLYRKAIQIKG